MAANVFHLSKSAEYGSPPLIIETARNLMGRIDIDVASSAFWNRRVRATWYFNKQRDALSRPWNQVPKKKSWRELQTLASPTIYLNPPGDADGVLVKLFWQKLVDEYLSGRIEQAFWTGFNLNQLGSLQTSYETTPLDFPTLFARRRSKYWARGLRGVAERKGQPGHCSYFTWLPPSPYRNEVFVKPYYLWKHTQLAEITYQSQRRHFIEHTELIGRAVFPLMHGELHGQYDLAAMTVSPPRERAALATGGNGLHQERVL